MSDKSMRALLLIEDNPGDARLFREMLKEQGSHHTVLTHVTCLSEAERHLAKAKVDVILLDLGLPDATGLAAVRRVRAAAPCVPLVVLTGLDNEALADRTLQEGAQDYLIKGEIQARALSRALRYAIERKSMEEALDAEKERAQVTLNSIGDAVVCTDLSGNITFLNLVGEKMSGWQLREAVGRPATEVFQIRDGTSQPRDQPAMDAGQSRPIHPHSDGILVRRDGREMPVEDSASSIHDSRGNATGAVSVLRDVTARKRLEQECETTQRLLASVFGVIDQALGVADHVGNFMMVNTALTRQLGWGAVELIGKPFTSVISEPSRKWLMRQLAAHNEPEQTFRLPTELLHRDGAVTAGEIVSIVIPQPDGREYRVVTYLKATPTIPAPVGVPIQAAIRDALKRHGSPVAVVAGKVQLIGLGDIREKLGDRRSEVSTGVLTVAEQILRRHLGPNDSCHRTVDDGFMLCFADLDEAAAQDRARAIAAEIRATLAGIAPEMASARVEGFAARISVTQGESGSDDAIIQMLESRLARERKRLEDGALAVLKSELMNAQILFQRARTDTNQLAPYTMVRLPKSLELSLDTLRALDRQDYGLESELLLLTGAAERLLSELSDNRNDVIMVPVRISTLALRRDAERWLQIARSMAQPGKRRLIVEITNLSRDIARSRMSDLVMMITSLCRAVAYELPVADPSFVAGLPITVPLVTIEAQRLGSDTGTGYIAVATKLNKTLQNRNTRLLIKNIASPLQAMTLAKAGVPLILTQRDIAAPHVAPDSVSSSLGPGSS